MTSAWIRPSFRLPHRFACSKRLFHAFNEPPRTTELPAPRLDYRKISENIVSKTTNSLNRKAPISSDTIQSVARNYTEFKRISTVLNAKRNARSIIGEKLRKSAEANDISGKDASLAEAKSLKDEISRLELELGELEHQLLHQALAIPNDSHPASPLGPEHAAVTLSSHGPEPLPQGPERDHLTIGRKLGLIDFESGANVTGSSWYFLTNEGALLEMALSNYALSVAIKHGFKPVTTPDVVRSEIAKRCGFQPRDHSDPPVTQSYHLESTSQELILSGTAEIPLAGMFANRIMPSTDLPVKVAGLGRAFRAEAGARGTDTRGLYRVHQFTKVELFTVTSETDSEQMMEEMKKVQMSILKGLELPFRVLDMPTEELGASAYRKYDMEVWMPGRGKWGEVSSLSNCTDYQSRRLLIRQTTPPKSQQTSHSLQSHNPFVHTLNGTAAAIPRLIVALLENGVVQNEAGEAIGLTLPAVLRPFWLGQDEETSIIHWSK
ncbi:seryl-tRNA synthetase [Mycena floridula]|nr:seryl-tRNA synthetase [Mycena floridula]